MAAESSELSAEIKSIKLAETVALHSECANLTGLRRAVYALCCMVPTGKVTTYGAIAQALDPPASARSVGTAMRQNPLSPSPVPCHRVLRSDLTLGGYSGHTDATSAALHKKTALLKAEGVNMSGSPAKAPVAAQHVFTEAQIAAAARIRGGAASSHAPTAAPGHGTKRTREGASMAVFTRPGSIRAACASGGFAGPTSGHCPGFAQANLVVLPLQYAADFKAFCDANPAPCPLLEVSDPGEPVLRKTVFCDVRTDAPLYRLHRKGAVQGEQHDLLDMWQGADAGKNASVAFLLGCSFSFEDALQQAGLPLRHVQLGKNVPMFKTNVQTCAVGPFKGPMVVSMRPMTPSQAQEATRITAQYPRVHGAPVHVGDPLALGIADISKPDYGEAVPVYDGEVCVFWACGVTPQAALAEAALPCIVATHAPGHMLVLDVTNEELKDSPAASHAGV